MPRSARFALLVAFTTAFAGCATNRQWAVSGGEKHEGLVRVSYEFPEYREPEVSDQAAEKLALQRCEGWGYDHAQPIAGQLRQCSNMDNGNCNLWTVTREYQCTRDVAQSSPLAR
jgi:YecR-like lipoprotein